jgi:hypothetical protein
VWSIIGASREKVAYAAGVCGRCISWVQFDDLHRHGIYLQLPGKNWMNSSNDYAMTIGDRAACVITDQKLYALVCPLLNHQIKIVHATLVVRRICGVSWILSARTAMVHQRKVATGGLVVAHQDVKMHARIYLCVECVRRCRFISKRAPQHMEERVFGNIVRVLH